MKKKLNKSKVVLVLIIVAVIIYAIIQWISAAESDLVDLDLPTVDISEGAVVDEEPPDDIIYINMSSENKILSCMSLGEFENGQILSTEQYLKVAYTALNNGYIETDKNTFSEEEINNIIYSIFNVKLSENKSIDGLKYTNGKYELEKGTAQDLVLNNSERSTAAGSIYVEFEVNGENYIARLNTNTATGEIYVQSVLKD